MQAAGWAPQGGAAAGCVKPERGLPRERARSRQEFRKSKLELFPYFQVPHNAAGSRQIFGAQAVIIGHHAGLVGRGLHHAGPLLGKGHDLDALGIPGGLGKDHSGMEDEHAGG